MKHSSMGIHIALSKYPLGKEHEFIANLDALYEKYRTNIIDYLARNTKSGTVKELEKRFEHLYKPKILHVYSHFDVAFVSLIDNFKFPQRVFEPLVNTVEDEKIKSVSYQILSGGIIATDRSPEPSAALKRNKDFLKIIQLKINNGLLIGNGAEIFDRCITLIEDMLIKLNIKNYILVNSYNWGEITIVCSDKSPQRLADFLMRIRMYDLKAISDKNAIEEIVNQSLYKKWGMINIENGHLFSETLSYLGADFFSYKDIDPKTPFYSNIEWQIKPGHFPVFAKEMENSPLNFSTDFKWAFFKNGKTDFMVMEKDPETINSNIELFKILRSNEKLRAHFRKIKTKPLFKIEPGLIKEFTRVIRENLPTPSSTEASLVEYKIQNGRDVAKYLRKLNISRNVRKKVSKIIYNYNLGIQDPILFIYFIDLHKLLKQFISDLNNLSSRIEEATLKGTISSDLSMDNYVSLKTTYIQKELIEKYIDIFEEAFQDRILNNYNYEDINEFSLDINSSLTGIVSSLDAVIKFLASCFRDVEGDSIVTTINDNETVSNKFSVNYNIEHITSAPLIFSTLIKEILNIDQAINLMNNNSNFNDLNAEFSVKTDQHSETDMELLYEFLKAYQFAYFEIDFKKYHLTFLKKTNLFIFWHWTYALQCTHLYSSVGYFDELFFTRELFRLLLLLKAVDSSEIDNLTCPIPELRSYWDKYFNRTVGVVNTIGNTAAFKKMTKDLREQVFSSINNLNAEKSVQYTKRLSTEDIFEIIKAKAIMNNDLSAGDFVSFIQKEIKMSRESAVAGSFSKSAYYKILTYVSFYNLHHIYSKFDGNIRLLRRNFENGAPLIHFLENDTCWYIDPFGGFFINDVQEREQYMDVNNKMLFLIWHIGTILKMETFINATSKLS